VLTRMGYKFLFRATKRNDLTKPPQPCRRCCCLLDDGSMLDLALLLFWIDVGGGKTGVGWREEEDPSPRTWVQRVNIPPSQERTIMRPLLNARRNLVKPDGGTGASRNAALYFAIQASSALRTSVRSITISPQAYACFYALYSLGLSEATLRRNYSVWPSQEICPDGTSNSLLQSNV
jgi:hypothetical protein